MPKPPRIIVSEDAVGGKKESLVVPVHTKHSLQTLIRTNDRALLRAVVAIYRRQESDEQHARATIHDNGVGFTAADASPMSQLARCILNGDEPTAEAMNDARERMGKYWKQLLDIAVARQFGL